MNLQDLGIFMNIFFYLVLNTVSLYNLKELIYSYTPSYFYSPTIY